MIKLWRGASPLWLIDNATRLLDGYKRAAPKSRPRVWRHSSIISSLKLTTNGKCMYCESLIAATSFAAVEHIRPKSKFPDLVVDWDNLGICCDRCNLAKLDYWTDEPSLRLINPYTDNPADHIEFIGPMAVPVLGSDRGKNTIRQLKLVQRDDLFVARARRIQELDARLQLWYNERRPAFRQLYADDILEFINTTQEYSAALSSFAAFRGFTGP
jgi:hypothetical protein